MLQRRLITSLLLLFPIIGYSQTVHLTNLRVNHLKHKLQYVVELTGEVPVIQHTYTKPYRKVFIFYHAQSTMRLDLNKFHNRYVNSVNVQNRKGRALIGLRLNANYPASGTFWSPDGKRGLRYVIDVDTSHGTPVPASARVNFNRQAALQEFSKTVGPHVHAFVQRHLGADASYQQQQAAATQSKPAYQKTAPTRHQFYSQTEKRLSGTKAQYHAPPAKAKQAVVAAQPLQVSLPVVSTTPSFNEKAKRVSDKIIVVIDPGHGGKDPGATGPSGYHEKKVVLQIAKHLQQDINSYRGFKAVLTRGDDRYLTLRYRLALARKYHGDMFVAIHADAFINHTAHGASVFALSQRGATSEAARWLAERENQSELMGGVDLADKDRTLRSVLIDLSQTATIGASLKMGSGIITHLRQIVPMHANHVEQAAFVVLKSPDIPSLLIETGFISNPTEEQLLIRRSHQKKLAAAIAKGIVHYFETHPPRGSWLAAHSSAYSHTS